MHILRYLHTWSHAAWYVEEPGVSLLLWGKEKESLLNANSRLFHQSHESKHDLTSHSHLSMLRFLLTHTRTHTLFHSSDFHNLFPHNVILGNQLDGIFWNDASSDESCQVFVVHLSAQKMRAFAWGRKEREETGALYSMEINAHLG